MSETNEERSAISRDLGLLAKHYPDPNGGAELFLGVPQGIEGAINRLLETGILSAKEGKTVYISSSTSSINPVHPQTRQTYKFPRDEDAVAYVKMIRQTHGLGNVDIQ